MSNTPGFWRTQWPSLKHWLLSRFLPIWCCPDVQVLHGLVVQVVQWRKVVLLEGSLSPSLLLLLLVQPHLVEDVLRDLRVHVIPFVWHPRTNSRDSLSVWSSCRASCSRRSPTIPFPGVWGCDGPEFLGNTLLGSPWSMQEGILELAWIGCSPYTCQVPGCVGVPLGIVGSTVLQFLGCSWSSLFVSSECLLLDRAVQIGIGHIWQECNFPCGWSSEVLFPSKLWKSLVVPEGRCRHIPQWSRQFRMQNVAAPEPLEVFSWSSPFRRSYSAWLRTGCMVVRWQSIQVVVPGKIVWPRLVLQDSAIEHRVLDQRQRQQSVLNVCNGARSALDWKYQQLSLGIPWSS